MRKQTVWIALVGALMFVGWLGAAEVKGSKDREFAERLGKMRQQVKELVEAGQNDQAARIKQEIGRLEEQQRSPKERGDQPDLSEAKRRLEELTRRLADLKERGQGDEAERVARQIEEIRQHLGRTATEAGDRPKQAPNRQLLEERLAGMKQRITDLKEAGRNEDADRLAQEAREMMRRAQGAQDGKASERDGGIEQRISHIREAAKHLDAAGLHDVADNLIRQAEQLAKEHADRSGNEARRDEDSQLAHRVDELSQALRDMRQRMERTDKQIQELSERVERR